MTDSEKSIRFDHAGNTLELEWIGGALQVDALSDIPMEGATVYLKPEEVARLLAWLADGAGIKAPCQLCQGDRLQGECDCEGK